MQGLSVGQAVVSGPVCLIETARAIVTDHGGRTSHAAAFRWWRLLFDGVGLARMGFVIGNAIRVHPLALTRFDRLPEGPTRPRSQS